VRVAGRERACEGVGGVGMWCWGYGDVCGGRGGKYVCVCVFVCGRERENETTERESLRVRGSGMLG